MRAHAGRRRSRRSPLARHSPDPPSRASAANVIVASVEHCDSGTATFAFDGRAEWDACGLVPAQQEKFVQDFRSELARIEAWARRANWPLSAPTDLRVFVSGRYKISKSLVPGWFGEKGRMEFPEWRVLSGCAAISHELVHVFYPNGNRLLAEGLAVHVQAEIGRNPAFPNFGRPLHSLAREVFHEMAVGAEAAALEAVAEMDRIATPNALVLKVGADVYAEDAYGQARVYPIAGSFVRFLIERHGMRDFRDLYCRTPLISFECRAGSPNRWIDIYGRSLAELALDWKRTIVDAIACTSTADKGKKGRLEVRSS